MRKSWVREMDREGEMELYAMNEITKRVLGSSPEKIDRIP